MLVRNGRVRVRSDEDVAVVHRRDQADGLRQQHAVAENVAGHVADAHAGEVLLLAVTPERAEVALDRLPAAAGGDAHALVVVADRTAGGECRSEEHTSELQSLMRISYAVFCLKKKTTDIPKINSQHPVK